MRKILIAPAISIGVVLSFSLQAQDTGHELDPVTITGSVAPRTFFSYRAQPVRDQG